MNRYNADGTRAAVGTYNTPRTCELMGRRVTVPDCAGQTFFDITPMGVTHLCEQLERELTAAATERDDLRLRVAQLEGVGDMWRTAELALTKAERDRDGYAQQVQRLTDELRQATRGAQ